MECNFITWVKVSKTSFVAQWKEDLVIIMLFKYLKAHHFLNKLSYCKILSKSMYFGSKLKFHVKSKISTPKWNYYCYKVKFTEKNNLNLFLSIKTKKMMIKAQQVLQVLQIKIKSFDWFVKNWLFSYFVCFSIKKWIKLRWDWLINDDDEYPKHI